jgi:hypothetical protein
VGDNGSKREKMNVRKKEREKGKKGKGKRGKGEKDMRE